jgi:glycosyltransferase involved in cell wall biosynthesis
MEKIHLNILVFSQYFWPENFRINDWCKGMIERGHNVTVVTGKPNYPSGDLDADYSVNPRAYDNDGGVTIIRVPMLTRGQSNWRLALNYASFALSSCIFGLWKLRGKRFDVSFVFGVSPITVALPAILYRAKTKTPVVLWVLDLWPESLRAVGIIRSTKVLKVLGYGVAWFYRRSDYILGQSHAFVQDIKRIAPEHTQVHYVSNWSDQQSHNHEVVFAPEITRDAEIFTILFSGNIGDAQDFPTILEAAQMLKSMGHNKPRVRWVIVGAGRQLAWLKAQVAYHHLDDVISVLGGYPLTRMGSFYQHADAFLVTLRADEFLSKTIPGKVQAYLEFGKPLLGAINGETARLIQQAKCGLVVDAGDAKGLSSAAIKLAASPLVQRVEMGQKGRAYYQQFFERKAVLNEFEKYLYSAHAK